MKKRKILIVNVKANQQGVGKALVKLAKTAKRHSKGFETVLAVQPSDILRVSKKIKTFSQHIDPIDYGSHTGWILPEAVKEAGAQGTLINHSERRVSLEIIRESVERAREVGLETVVCTASMPEAKAVAKYSPDFIAFEDPELIGTLKSVSKLEPRTLKEFVKAVKKVNPNITPLCGAGVANGDDVKAALRLGTRGVLLATAVVKARDPAHAIKNLGEGFRL